MVKLKIFLHFFYPEIIFMLNVLTKMQLLLMLKKVTKKKDALP